MTIFPILKKISRGCLCLLAAAAFTAIQGCSDDKINEPEGGEGNGLVVVPDGIDAIFIDMDFSTPSRSFSRSETNSGGGSTGDSNQTSGTETEDGQENEKTLTSFKVYFFVKDGNDLWTQPIEGIEGEVKGNTIRVETKLEEFKKLAGNLVRVLLTVNMPAASVPGEELDTEGAFGMGNDVEAKPLGKFVEDGIEVPFSNKNEFIVDLTGLSHGGDDAVFLQKIKFILERSDRTLNVSDGSVGGEVKAHGDLELERSIARVDYRPKTWTKNGNNDDPQVFQVGTINNLYGKMYSLQVFNVSTSSYYFRHTSEGNDKVGKKPGGNQSIFGVENDNKDFGKTPSAGTTDFDNTSFTWILDDDWDTKDAFTTASTTVGWAGPVAEGTTPSLTDNSNHYFLNQPVKKTGQPIYTILESDKGIANVYDTSSDNGFKKTYNDLALNDNYLPLFYLSENTLPSTAAMINGLSTGIAFKMVISNADGDPLKTGDFISRADYESQMDALLAEEERLEAKKEEGTFTNEDNTKLTVEIPAAKAVLNKKVIGSLGPSAFSGFYEMKIGSSSTYLEKVGNLFVMTYYYYFKHNVDRNHVLGNVEPMQYAVVRNNVYKICVTALNGLPEPYDPSKHDEPQENVIAVETNILSWARIDKVVDL